MCSQLHPQSPPSPMPSVAFYRNHKDWPSPVLCVYVCVCVFILPTRVPWEWAASWNVSTGSASSSAGRRVCSGRGRPGFGLLEPGL